MNKEKILTLILAGTIILSGCSQNDNTYKQENSPSVKQESEVKVTKKESKSDSLTYTIIPNLSSEDFTGLEMLDSEAHSNDIFLVGEAHGISSNELMKLKLLKYFKERTDIKYLLVEYPPSCTYFLNQYLKTGDTKILDSFFPKLYPSQVYSKNFYNYIIDVYNYNKTLGDEYKLTFVGIDIEHRPNISFQCLNELLPDNAPDKSISPSISAIRQVTDESYDRDAAYELGVSLKESMDKYPSIYEDYLEDDYFLFQLIVENLVQGKKSYEVNETEFNSVRDPFIYKNFERMDSTLPEGKYFGQWGKYHVSQKRSLSVNWFASLLDGEDSKYHDKITSIIYMYRDSKNLTVTKDRTLEEQFFGDMTPLFVPIDSKLESKYALYKLTPDLKISDINFDIKGSSPSTDYYQYVITINGSAASTPLDEIEK